MNCLKNNFGCFDGGVCWANCGPRVRTSDYCFTTNITSETIKVLKDYIEPTENPIAVGLTEKKACVLQEDCDPCAPCISPCFMSN